MNIPEWLRRGKDWLLVGILVLSSTASFGLGVLAGREQGREAPEDDFWVEKLEQDMAAPPQPAAVGVAARAAAGTGAAGSDSPEPSTEPTAGAYVASKSGTKYYLPWCGTVNRIKEENRVWFATKADAEVAGYEPASNCKGL